jgi:hypothetical protein
MLDRCWRDKTWLDADVETLHIKKFDLNDPQYVLSS